MKKHGFLWIFISLFCVTRAQMPVNTGTSQPGKNLPPLFIENKFRQEYPDITPVWYEEDKFYIAQFTDTNVFKGINIVYDRKGKVVRRESELDNSSYPQAINDYFVKHYPGEKFRTWKSQDDQGTQRYCIRRSAGVLWFDQEGRYLEPEKKNAQTAAVN